MDVRAPEEIPTDSGVTRGKFIITDFPPITMSVFATDKIRYNTSKQEEIKFVQRNYL